jgi:symplekin
MKSTVLRIWDGASPPVKICCIKFAQRVVLAQTKSNGQEHKVWQMKTFAYKTLAKQRCVVQNPGLDISLSSIPPNHALLDSRQLEAEATGLLDRMLGVLQDNSR